MSPAEPFVTFRSDSVYSFSPPRHVLHSLTKRYKTCHASHHLAAEDLHAHSSFSILEIEAKPDYTPDIHRRIHLKRDEKPRLRRI